jgi:hypothetical protein
MPSETVRADPCNTRATPGGTVVATPPEEIVMNGSRLASPVVVTSIRCGKRCGLGAGPLAAHHDRLLAAETDLEALLEFMELAVTWGELDYSTSDVVPPAMWAQFCEQHTWRDAGTMRRIFDLATDLALRSETGDRAGTDTLAALRSFQPCYHLTS